ncbi:MAG TPA: aminodeoxychorismate/anthranilate synthase component II [Gemmatimonadales bacterium]
MIVLVDNYDSFVHNLARYVRELGGEPRTIRNDAMPADELAALAPSHVIVSPGPCTPAEAGISTELIRRLAPTTPILGVCLGHQAIGAAFGARVVRSRRPMHGKTSPIIHDGTGVLAGLPNPFPATRYHSLALDRASLPAELAVNAVADDGEIMGVRHTAYPVHGVQFHPESILTEGGYDIVRRFLELNPRG